MAKQNAIKVAILWHMHQPNYREPNSDRLAMPWVRLHATKDYLDMPLTAAEYDNVRVTFNLVPSLIDQLELYLAGGTDDHLELSKLRAEDLPADVKLDILESFFVGHVPNMIDPHPRFRELHRKYSGSATQKSILPALFTSAEIRDLQVWSNLAWVDPLFYEEEPVKSLMEKHRNFTEDEKLALLEWQKNVIRRIVPTYRRLLEEGRIDVSFTPYYHPILPLLCDTDCAREALPGIKLPRQRFRHPEDAEIQVQRAVDRYQSLFGRKLAGMWPSEGSVSDEVLQLLTTRGISWAATDEEILHHSLAKSGLSPMENPIHSVYEYASGLKLLFRDHRLSDRVGFVYSGWNSSEAVDDFLGHLMHLRGLFKDRLGEVVVPVILDGENAWEYFPKDGRDFLQEFYRTLGEHPEVELVTMSEAVATLPARRLPNIFAGSWINHNFRIWIGHDEDNAAWDLLKRTRDTLVTYQQEHPQMDPATRDFAWEQIYIAEGSDWCWWYGDEHRGAYNDQFDGIFRKHLMAVYQILDLKPPAELFQPIHGGGELSATTYPDDVLTAQIDGRLTHFYEWAGSGLFDCLKAAGVMHRVDRHVAALFFAYDHNRLYIRLDFHERKRVQSVEKLRFECGFFTPDPVIINLTGSPSRFAGEVPGQYEFAMDDILELAVERQHLWARGYGSVGITVTVYDGDRMIETWPENEPIQLEVPERNKEIFWPS